MHSLFTPSVRAEYEMFGGRLWGTTSAVWSSDRTTLCKLEVFVTTLRPSPRVMPLPPLPPLTNPQLAELTWLAIVVSFPCARVHIVLLIFRPKSGTAKELYGEENGMTTLLLLAWSHASAAAVKYVMASIEPRRKIAWQRIGGRRIFCPPVGFFSRYLAEPKSEEMPAPSHIEINNPSLQNV